MTIYLGDLTVEQIEKRTGIELTEADREYLKENHQAAVNDREIEHGKWHCFDLPFMLMTGDKDTAIIYRDMLTKYDWTKCKEPLQIGWGK